MTDAMNLLYSFLGGVLFMVLIFMKILEKQREKLTESDKDEEIVLYTKTKYHLKINENLVFTGNLFECLNYILDFTDENIMIKNIDMELLEYKGEDKND